MAKFEKAYIAIKGSTFPVMYNPTEYTYGKKAVYGGLEDTAKKKNQFQRTEEDNFTVSLFFDTYADNSDVRDKTKPITDLILPTIKKRKFKEPPVCTFVWGKFSYRGAVIKCSQKFTMFLTTGIPVRSNLDITFESRPSTKQLKEYSNRSSSRKFFTIKAGDRIDLVAYKTLDNAHYWRTIAEFNNINNPLTFPEYVEKGRNLVIPDLG